MRRRRPGSSVSSLRGDRAIGVGDAPELLRVAEVQGGDVVEPLPGAHDVLPQQGEGVRRRHEPAADIGDERPSGSSSVAISMS